MSYSSLYGINKKFFGKEIATYRNCFYFAPIVLEVLPEKYVPHLVYKANGFWGEILEKRIFKNSILRKLIFGKPMLRKLVFGKSIFRNLTIGSFGEDVWKATNNIVNECGSTVDRVCYELCNQQIFFTKDKLFIANAIRQFLVENKPYYKCAENGISFLENEHIIKRFQEIADDIENLDEGEYEYFVFKCSSIDDDVEYWFHEYDEESDKYIPRALFEIKNVIITEFVVIENNTIKEFINNCKFFNSETEILRKGEYL